MRAAYSLLYADNIELRDAQLKGIYANKEAAIRALHTELMLACSEYDIQPPYRFRFTELPEDRISVDFGSWSHFIGLTGVTMADLDMAGA